MSPSTPGARRIHPLAWIALGLVALVGATWAALAIMFPPARLRALVQRQLGAALAREVRFDDARIGLWPPVRLTVDGLALAEPGGFANGAAFQARSLHLDLEPLGLIVRRLVVRRLVLDQPTGHLVLRADGSTNLGAMGAPAAPGRASTPMDLAVREFVVRGGQVLVDDYAAARRTRFGVDTRTSFSLTGRGARVATAGVTQVSDLAFGPLSAARGSDLNRSLAGLEWKIEHRGAIDLPTRRLALQRLSLVLGRAEVALAGIVDAAGAAPSLDLRARGTEIDLGQVLEYLSRADARLLNGIHGAGRLQFDLAVRGPWAGERRPALTGTLGVRDGEFRYPGVAVGVENTSFTARFAPDSIVVGDLAARVSGQPVRGELEVTSLADPRVRFGLRGGLDLAAVSRFLAPKDTRLGGRADVDLRGRGRAKDPGTLALEGWAKLAGASVAAPQLPKPLERIQGEIDFSSARARVKALEVHAGQSSFTLDASVARPLALMAKPSAATRPAEVDFSLRSPYLDLAELLPATPGGPMMANARGGGRVEIARLKNRRLDVEKVSARVRLEPGITEVSEFGLKAYGGDVRGNARFDYSDAAKPAVALKAKVDSARAEGILGAWTGVGKLLRGSITTDLDLSAQGTTEAEIQRSLSAAGLASLVNGTLGPMSILDAIASVTRVPAFREVQFSDARVPFKVERGRVATGPATLSGNYGEWRIAGAVGFDGSLDYTANVLLPPEIVQKLGAGGAVAAGAFADEKGRVLLDLKIGGNTRSPRVSLDERAMRDRLLGRAVRSLTGQRGGEPRDSLGAPGSGSADSARAAERSARRALEDSLRNQARSLFKGLFGTPKDSTRR